MSKILIDPSFDPATIFLQFGEISKEVTKSNHYILYGEKRLHLSNFFKNFSSVSRLKILMDLSLDAVTTYLLSTETAMVDITSENYWT